MCHIVALIGDHSKRVFVKDMVHCDTPFLHLPASVYFAVLNIWPHEISEPQRKFELGGLFSDCRDSGLSRKQVAVKSPADVIDFRSCSDQYFIRGVSPLLLVLA